MALTTGRSSARSRRRATRRTARTAVVSCAALAAGLLPASGAVASVETTARQSPSRSEGKPFASPDRALGKNWQTSADRAVVGTGDSKGFHILVADESQSFRYREAANLTEAGLDGIGPWTGYVCTTGSGRYAAAVYAPSMVANKPALMQHGAFAAVVDLTTGKVTRSVSGVQLAYFSPGCGQTDTVTFTRSAVGDSGHGTTKLFDVDAGTGKTVSTRTVQGQFTNPLPTADGDIGVLGGRLVKVAPSGRATTIADLPGRLFALAPSTGGAVDLAVVTNGKDVLHRWNGKKLTKLGTAPLGKLGLFPRRGGDLVAGEVTGIDTAGAPGLAKADAPDRPLAASHEGHLLTTSAASEELKGITSKIGSSSGQGAGLIDVQALATASDTAAATQVTTAEAVTAATDDVEPDVNGQPEKDALAQSGLAPDEPNPQSHYSNCLVKRNDPHAQALQPSPNMVEWAVDQAVHGDLNITRPANYLGTGSDSYTPEGLFPRVSLTGGGTVPAQVVLGILAQESNFKQASWHSVPGDGGNPLLGDYFGNGDSIHYYPNGGAADCGYGIAQVTSGMNEAKPNPYNPTEAYAIATDYAANIAAGVQILSKTWNQLKGLGMNVNIGNPAYIENWSMALWGYNSGVYTDSSQNGGNTGLGWFNNPANPNYRSDRAPFLRDSYDDAAHPAEWPYEEKIMGWVESPQLTYNAKPSYALPQFPVGGNSPAGKLNLNMNYRAYCDSSNNCNPGAASDSDPCPAEDESCWFRGSVSWGAGSDTTNGSTENLVTSLGSGEPALNRQYDAGPCNNAPAGLLIDDLPDPDDNTQGCNESHQIDGKFNLQLGDNFTYNRSDSTVRATGDIASIDLHQLGAGYDGHAWFTHAYKGGPGNAGDLWHKVTATWTPNPSLMSEPGTTGLLYDIYVHLPNHGAQAIVPYTVNVGMSNAGVTATRSCSVNQTTKSNGHDTWVELGTVRLWQGANLQADNTSRTDYTGDADVAYDAVVFSATPQASSTGICFHDAMP
ncbi:transglycosylase SLT domain-containing protein [Streptomyces sp. NPDC058231]|uniref:transglycosylase SLT domain-containing protein n=1 Tax=Streptomyces sp. NPDC058231 TaxID=3346392 RepID=UPI0036E0C4F0